MKRITLLFCLLTASLGFSQVVLEDFEGDAPEVSAVDGASASISTTEAVGTKSLEIISSSAGQPWQQAELVFQGDWIDLTTTKTATVDVYSNAAFTMLAKVIEPVGAGPESATSASHTGNGWETLLFDFSLPEDNTGAANDIYGAILFLPNWDGTGSGTNTTNNNWNDATDATYYVDNITGIAIAAPETCNDGILNNEETEIDCGGPNCGPCAAPPTSSAPTPPSRPAADVFSVYSDAYTNETSELAAFGGGSLEVFDIGGDEFVGLSGAPGANLQWFFGIPAGVDISSFTHYHMDFYYDGDVPGEGAIFQTIIQGFDAVTSVFTGNTLHNVIPAVTGQWLSLDIPISTFNGGVSVRDNIGQMQLAMAGPAFGPTYIDNVYFHNDTVLSTDDFETTTFRAFPNPTNGDWNISGNSIINSVAVYDILGKQVISLTPNATETVIDASSLNSGMYFARIEGIEGSKTVKLIKE
jgi:hypothetical protein